MVVAASRVADTGGHAVVAGARSRTIVRKGSGAQGERIVPMGQLRKHKTSCGQAGRLQRSIAPVVVAVGGGLHWVVRISTRRQRCRGRIHCVWSAASVVLWACPSHASPRTPSTVVRRWWWRWEMKGERAVFARFSFKLAP